MTSLLLAQVRSSRLARALGSKPKRDAVALVNDPKSSWQELYLAALLEPDQQKLTELLMAVEEAMFHRAPELTNSYADNQERIAMNQAVEKLLIIKTEKLGWPGIKQRNSDRD
jgi:transcription elongation factor GreA-like protein